MTHRSVAGLIVVDMQNAFIAPSHGTGVPGAAEVIDMVNHRVAAAVAQGQPIFYTRDIDPTGHAATGNGYDEAMHPDVRISGPIVDKGPGSMGGFSGFVLAATALPNGQPGAGGLSALPQLLRQMQVEAVTVVGLAADVCVASTAVDAVRLGYTASVDLDATAFVHVHPGGDNATIAELIASGVRVTPNGQD